MCIMVNTFPITLSPIIDYGTVYTLKFEWETFLTVCGIALSSSINILELTIHFGHEHVLFTVCMATGLYTIVFSILSCWDYLS